MTYLARVDIIDNNGEVNYLNFSRLVENIYESKNEDKLNVIPELNSDSGTISKFLDHLETLPFTSKKIGYEFRKPLEFEGVKYSQKTDMFYKMEDGKLYRLPNYKRNENMIAEDDGKVGSDIVYTKLPIEWVESTYSDYNGMSEFWTDMTIEQDERFEVSNKWDKFIKDSND